MRTRTGTATTAHGFVRSLGHTSEAETGLIYMRARYMDPTVGRFVSEDLAGSGVNWFEYAADCPTCKGDFNGRDDFSLVGTLGTMGIMGALNAVIGCAEAGDSSNALKLFGAGALAGIAGFGLLAGGVAEIAVPVLAVLGSFAGQFISGVIEGQDWQTSLKRAAVAAGIAGVGYAVFAIEGEQMADGLIANTWGVTANCGADAVFAADE